MLHQLLATVLLAVLSLSIHAGEFPTSPDSSLTPGSFCDSPVEYRYAERIPYCERDVSSQEKKEIFENYRNYLGYTLNTHRRNDYKIDHYIPLCAGGSNKNDNLWPQHVTVFSMTDPIESIGCEKLRLGKIKQKTLVKLIIEAKNNLSKASAIFKSLQAL